MGFGQSAFILTALLPLPLFKQKKTDRERAPEQQPEEKIEGLKHRLALYRKIVERYREHIEASEDKSVPELKNLVQPESKAIREMKEKIASKFNPYIYERDFPQAAKLAFEFVRDEIANEQSPLEFWLAPDDVMELKGADEMDKAIFLCSLLIALENSSARVVVETQASLRHAFVMFEFGGAHNLMDPVHNVSITGSREELVKRIAPDGMQNRIIYEFNDKGYWEW